MIFNSFTNTMKIVYLLPGGLFNSGGMERVVSIKANYLAEKVGYDVSIITADQMGRPVFYPISDKIHLYHLDINFIDRFGQESYLQKLISRWGKVRAYKKQISRLLMEIRPDITISTLGGWDIGFINRLKDGSIKTGELHFTGNYRQLMARKLSNAFIPNLVAKWRTYTFKTKCMQLSRLVVLTSEEKSFWKNQKNISVIPNPLLFIPSQSATLQPKRAIAIGRLVYEKGFDQLIEIWQTVFQQRPDWTLSIFGSGNQKQFLLDLIHQQGLESVITIQDPVKDIHAQLMEHSILLFSSRYLEAFGLVLTEAMSCGLPLVAFDAPCGPKDVITDGENGYLVPAGNKKLFAEKVCTLMESEELRKTMGKRAKQMSLDYQEDKIMNQWINLFENEYKRHRI
ncbi:glycosyl transferase [Bacteroidia bacterium]|nr:glycosyl transferase [Bacteroidia bacterium]